MIGTSARSCSPASSCWASSASALPSTPHAREWGVLAALALVASRFPLRVPGRNAWFSISDTFFMTSALLFGPGPATLTIALDSMLMTHAFKTCLVRAGSLFNSSAPAIAFWAGAQVFFVSRGSAPLYGTSVAVDALVLPVAGFATVYFRAELRPDSSRDHARKGPDRRSRSGGRTLRWCR